MKSKFYELSTQQRLQELQKAGYLTMDDLQLLIEQPALPEVVASNLVENQIGSYPLPLGLATNFLIDGKQYLIPLATEEPSVVAAASNAAKRSQASGGFQTRVQRQGLSAQVVFQGQLTDAQVFLQQHLAKIKQIAHQAHPSLQEHGGGLRQVSVQNIVDYVEFNLLIDTGEAMGANIVNTIAEAIGDYLQQQLPQLSLLMAILSNDAPTQMANASTKIAFDQLATADLSGQQVAQKISAASDFAQISPQRAATQNKGIMNSIEALILATGNDTRNVNAAAYSVLNDTRKTWSNWHVVDQYLVGEISLPLPLGVVGGAISTLPLAQLNLRLLQNPSAEQLMGITAAVGLASNLAALRALVTQGIQAGHMNLQLQSLALMAGATALEVDTLTEQLRKQAKQANLTLAKKLLAKLRN
ncbi:hydroxymethylglutaryl-CoA reductase, degradative [Bombilactobacillus thymidiniphilus]|uniref:3-hydroxy-3-methylglutaryl coenzyme A reductase n=1 Tax=Bombilactobacillus thymidiniphilus TaxID=2923363 RepID=A0ABY4PCM6_9LACO|nr:hydroxymethylglutaryl-CoA reductase, degradative [Bombilactobacillus thymidiniphilus]UQS83256.1 hydroxymethylglutaryl-CoA reductase, degradative [Bombilactobacillus thymidiniphilus]